VTQSLPYTGGSYNVAYLYGYAVFTAMITPLKVSFDGTNSVYVRVGYIYASHLCGLCGNFDGSSANDWQMPSGLNAVDGTQLGESWTVPDSDSVE
jgi:von Willebrand factor type D domain